MLTVLRSWLGRANAPAYSRRPPLVLINGLAEQAESWFRNVAAWRHDQELEWPRIAPMLGQRLDQQPGSLKVATALQRAQRPER